MSDTEMMMRLAVELKKHPQTKAMIGREALLLRCVEAAQLTAPVAQQGRLDRAERALLRAGFQDLGGEEWKPPLGKPPIFVEVPAAPVQGEGEFRYWSREKLLEYIEWLRKPQGEGK